jgi:hypothetical protein
LHAHGRWFSTGTPASSTTKTGGYDTVEILLKVALNTKNQSINQSIKLRILLKKNSNLAKKKHKNLDLRNIPWRRYSVFQSSNKQRRY